MYLFAIHLFFSEGSVQIFYPFLKSWVLKVIIDFSKGSFYLLDTISVSDMCFDSFFLRNYKL